MFQAGQLLTMVNREEPRALGSQRKLRAVVRSLNDSISVTRELVRSIELLTQNLGVGPAFKVLRSLRVVVRPALGKGLGWGLQPPALQLVWRIGTKLEEPGRQMPRWMWDNWERWDLRKEEKCRLIPIEGTNAGGSSETKKASKLQLTSAPTSGNIWYSKFQNRKMLWAVPWIW